MNLPVNSILQGGNKGYKVTGKKNGNSIFLPAAGYRGGSSLGDVGSRSLYWSYRDYVLSVRPVANF